MTETAAQNPFAPTTVAVLCQDGPDALPKRKAAAQARAWLESDPYFAAGFWARIEYRPFLPAAGDLVGGTAW